MIRLSEGEVHLWCASPGEWDDPGLAAEAHRILDADEIARMEGIRVAEGRRLFGVSHLLVRAALSGHADRDPRQWRFVRNSHGKPRIDPAFAPGAGVADLAFNLAHTRGLAVVAVTSSGEIGVDVERRDRPIRARILASRFFAPEEAAVLGKLPAARLQERFILYWTLKEAAIKALGGGLSVPLGAVGFHLAGRRPHRIAPFGAALPETEQWRFALLALETPYIAALAVRVDPGRTLILKGHRLGPAGEVSAPPLRPLGLSPGLACR